MKLTKRQLKRIIREEYSRLKRRGLIRESVENRAYQLADELMAAFPNGCTWDEGLKFSMGSGYTEEEYASAIDAIGHQEKGM